MCRNRSIVFTYQFTTNYRKVIINQDRTWCDFLCLKYYRVIQRDVWRLFLSNEGALVAQINDLHFWKNNVYLQRLNGITLCVIFVYAMPLFGTQNSESVLNASNANCNCHPCPNRTMKCVYKRDIEIQTSTWV